MITNSDFSHEKHKGRNTNILLSKFQVQIQIYYWRARSNFAIKKKNSQIVPNAREKKEFQFLERNDAFYMKYKVLKKKIIY